MVVMVCSGMLTPDPSACDVQAARGVSKVVAKSTVWRRQAAVFMTKVNVGVDRVAIYHNISVISLFRNR